MFKLLASLLLLSSFGFATAFSSTATGNASAGATWVGGVAPSCVGNDIITVNSGHTVTLDTACSSWHFGNAAAAVGIGVTVQGNSSVSFGHLIIPAGVSLQVAGFDISTNASMRNNQFGEIEFQAGSTLAFDCPTDGKCEFINFGLLYFEGISGAHVTVTNLAADRNWNNAGSAAPNNVSSEWYIFNSVKSHSLGKSWIANSTGTGIGSLADTSVAITLQTAGTMTTEVSSIGAVNGAGTYYINYDTGMIYWWQPTGNTTFTANYKFLTFTGGAIGSTLSGTFNEITVNFTDFSYVGTLLNGGTDWVINCANKQSDTQSGNTHRKCNVTNSTFTYYKRGIAFTSASSGSSSDPILITGNTFNATQTDTFGGQLESYRSSTSFLQFSGNIVTDGVASASPGVIACQIFGTVSTNSNWQINGNVFWTPTVFSNPPAQCVWPDGQMQNNLMRGMGSASDSFNILDYSGTSGHPTIVSNNVIVNNKRGVVYASYETIQNNYFYGMTAATIMPWPSNDDIELTSPIVQNNIFAFQSQGEPIIKLGSGKHLHTDGAQINNNTIASNCTASIAIMFFDAIASIGPSLSSNVNQYANLISGCPLAFSWPSDTATRLVRQGFVREDWNDLFNDTTNYSGYTILATPMMSGSEYNSNGSRAVLGASIFDTNYSPLPSAAQTLAETFTSATNITLAWGGGTALQLINDSGTATSAANATTNGVAALWNGTLTDTTKAWTTAQNVATTQMGNWIKITAGTGVGQIRRITTNTATVLTVVPAWTTIPDATSTYSIYLANVKLFDSGAVKFVNVGIDARSLPAATVSDAGITIQSNGINANPNFVNANVNWITWDTSVGGPGTEDDAFSRVQATPSLVTSSLLPYLRNGFSPTNTALKSAGPPSQGSSFIGAVPVLIQGGKRRALWY